MKHYQQIVEGSGLPEIIKIMFLSRELDTSDHIDEAYSDLIHFLKHKEYYILLDRIEKNEAWLAEQTDQAKIARYRVKLNELAIQLEALTPKEEIA